ncbi:glycosyltransferase family 2 protein [Shewanella sp. 10N.286.45.A1]|uniref:glycosyltransferase family 2 protein n=1 Tax=Shewanella sp. 10N.286.45.A1 TaxID=3229694 RepID=UPI00354B50D3
MHSSILVEIFISTYNGDKYLGQQLDSLLSQTHKNLLITIRDDGSTDRTLDIISTYIKRYPKLIRLIPSTVNLGSTKSFLTLLNSAADESVLFMFCDQDDVWLDDKVSNSIAHFFNSEFLGPGVSFTDLTVVSSDLTIIHNSMMESMRINPSVVAANTCNLLSLNTVAGCTMTMNRHVLDLLATFKFPPKGVVHDHWISIIVSHFGRVEYLDRSDILYRQHTENQVGSLVVNYKYLIGRFKSIGKTFTHDRSILTSLKPRISLSPFLCLFYKIKSNLQRVF